MVTYASPLCIKRHFRVIMTRFELEVRTMESTSIHVTFKNLVSRSSTFPFLNFFL